MPFPPPRPDLDDAIDEAVRALTDVDPLEARSRQRMLMRLDASSQARRSFDHPVAWATFATAALVVLIAVVWVVRRPGGVQAPGPSSGLTVRSAPVTRPQPVEPAGRVADAVTGSGTPTRPAPRTRTSSPATYGSRHRTAPTGVREADESARLSAFIRAIQALPPDVWQRVDAAGPPPPVMPLAAVELSTTPLTVDPLPTSDWSSDSSVPSGGPR
jgi:hypothetical protein